MNKLVKNSLFGSGSFIIVSFVALITTPYVVHTLTSEVYGIYILITSLVGYYALVDLGLGQGVVKFISENVARGERKQAAAYLNAAILMQSIIGIITTSVLMYFSYSLVGLLRVPNESIAVAVFGIRICSIGFLFTMISSTLAAALQGLQRYDITSTVEASMSILLNVVIVVLLILGYGLREIIIVTTLSAFILLFIYVTILHVQLPEWKASIQIKKKEMKEIIHFSLYIFVSRASNLFANYFIRFLVAIFAGPAAVTLYVVPSKLVGAIGGVLSSGANAIFPYSSETHAIEPEKIKVLFYKGTRIFAVLSFPVLLFVIVYSPQLLIIWMGEAFADQSWIILSVLAFSGLIAAQTTVPNLIISGMGHSKTLGFFGLLALVGYSIFLPIFTYYFGVIGTAVGMLITTVAVIGFVLYKTAKIVEIELFRFLKETFIEHLVPIILITIIYSLVTLNFTMTLLLKLSIGVAMFTGYYIYIFLKIDEVAKYLRILREHYFAFKKRL